MDERSATLEHLNRTATGPTYDGADRVEPVARLAEVGYQLERIDSAGDRLHAMLSQLEDTLGLVLGPGLARGGEDCAERPLMQTTLGQALGGLADRIEGAVTRVQELNDRARVAL